MTETDLQEKYGNLSNLDNTIIPNNNETIPTHNDDEIINQMAAQIKDPGNVNDIRLQSKTVEEQLKYINAIKSMPRYEINKLLIGLGKACGINPNENEFHTCSKKGMAQYYLKKYKQQQLQKQK